MCSVPQSKGTFHTVYIAKVRITVRTAEASIIREGFGTGDAHAPAAGEAHDKAIKTAETDATKRAFATFGKPFGLSLYLGSRRTDPPPIERRRTDQRLGPSGRYYVPARPRTTIDPALKLPHGQTHTPAELREPDQSKSVQSKSASTVSEDRTGSSKQLSIPSPDPGTKVPSPTTEAMLRSRETAPASSGTAGQSIITRNTRRRDTYHLRFVANQPCLVCSRTPSDAHHLKFTQPMALSKKVSDEFTVPLCRIHHRQLHHGGSEVNLVDRHGYRSAADRQRLMGSIASGQRP